MVVAIDRSVWVTDSDFEAFVPLVIRAGGGGAVAPRLSPEGARVAYVDLSGEHITVRVVTVGGKHLAALDVGFDGPSSLAWSVDGTTLYMAGQAFREDGAAWRWRDADASAYGVEYLRSRDVIAHSPVEPLFAIVRDADIWVQPADGGAPTNLTGPLLPIEILKMDPRWSPDGRLIVFRAVFAPFDERNGFYVISRDGTGLRQVVSDPSRRDIRAIFSPDERELLVHRRSLSAVGDEIVLRPLDGSEQRIVFSTGRESEVDFDW